MSLHGELHGRAMTEQEAIEAARTFIWDGSKSYPVYPLDDDGDVDWSAVRDGDYHWNMLEEFEILRSEVIDSPDQQEDSYTVEVEARYTWSDNNGPIEQTFHVYIPIDADAEQTDFEFDPVA